MKNQVYILLLVLLFIYSCNGSTIYKTAYINKTKNGFIITLRGKGTGHPAGFSDVFFPKTFNDSMQYLIPRDIGIVKGEELPHDTCCYKSTGTITISKDKIDIDLLYKNTDDNRLEQGTWNGNYDLVRVK